MPSGVRDYPATVELYRDLAAAIDWEADDPRVAAVADRVVALLEAADAEGWENHDEEITDELAELLDSVFLDSLPIAHRLMERLEKRGWRGWTKGPPRLDRLNRRIASASDQECVPQDHRNRPPTPSRRPDQP